jgi:hypothetical protein
VRNNKISGQEWQRQGKLSVRCKATSMGGEMISYPNFAEKKGLKSIRKRIWLSG